MHQPTELLNDALNSAPSVHPWMPKIAATIAFVGLCLDLLLEGHEDLIPAVSRHIGDWRYIVCYGGVLPALGGRYLINRGMHKIGRWLPKVTAMVASIYMALGESVLPGILPGAADLADVPVVLIAGTATYFGVDYVTSFKAKEPAGAQASDDLASGSDPTE